MAEKKKVKTNPYSKHGKTHTGHNLTDREAVFIDKLLELGNQRQAILEAGYKTTSPGQYAQELMRKPYIKEEIDYRRQQLASQRIADATEVLEYFTSVMRGEKKDQFGLEAPLSERTKAAQELAKRQIDIPNRIQDKPQAEVKITLDWKRNS
jgi:phage terminase small subunit